MRWFCGFEVIVFARFRTRSGKKLAILRACARRSFPRISGRDSVRWSTRWGLPMPSKKPAPRSDELLRSQLDNVIDIEHALVKLARLIDWSRFDEAFGRFYHEKGRPGLSTRLMAGVHLFKHMEGLVCPTRQSVPAGCGFRGHRAQFEVWAA